MALLFWVLKRASRHCCCCCCCFSTWILKTGREKFSQFVVVNNNNKMQLSQWLSVAMRNLPVVLSVGSKIWNPNNGTKNGRKLCAKRRRIWAPQARAALLSVQKILFVQGRACAQAATRACTRNVTKRATLATHEACQGARFYSVVAVVVICCCCCCFCFCCCCCKGNSKVALPVLCRRYWG